jgi:hypothetical protein
MVVVKVAVARAITHSPLGVGRANKGASKVRR